MNHTSNLSISYSNTSPNHGKSYQTVADYEWLLKRFTAPEWSVETVRFEDNDHCGAKSTTLDATLTHEADSLIQVSPFDPWEHQPGHTIYRKHRIRLRDGYRDSASYVTIDNEAASAAELYRPLPASFATLDIHPLRTAPDLATFHSQEQVHDVDRELCSAKTTQGRGYSVESIPRALLATFAAAQRITKGDPQPDLTSFVSANR